MKKTLQHGLLAALIISITACGGGGGGGGGNNDDDESSSSLSSSSAPSSMASSSSSSSAGVSTTYTVSVSAPLIQEDIGLIDRLGELFIIPRAFANGEGALTSENFAIVVVDLAGNVLERIEVEENDITQNENGTYSINVPGNPRLDRLIVTNLNGPVLLPVAGNINDVANLLFAPTTAENIDIDLGSTAGYVNFLEQLGGEGSFAELDLDVDNPDDIALVESIINNVQEVINNQIVVGFASIADAMTAIQEAVVAIVKQEALNITNPAPTEITVASSIQDGGVYWYESLEPGYIEYGAIVGTEPEVIHLYNGSAFEAYEDDYAGQLILSDGEWVNSLDGIQAHSFGEDGSAILIDPAALDHQYHVQSTLSFSLTGRNIADYFYANFNTRALANILNPATTFGENAVGIRLNVTSVSDTYTLWFNTGDDEGVCPWDTQKNANDFGGNCETLGIWNNNYEHDNAITSMANVLSANVAAGATGFAAVSINWPNDNQAIAAQLINNQAKTAKYYLLSWAENSPVSAIPIGEGTWSYINLPGIEGDTAQAIRIEVPEQTLGNGEFYDDENVFIMALHNGYVRLGNFEAAGKLVETEFTVLNGAAHADIQAAVNYTNPLLGAWQFENDYFIFSDNTKFTHIKTATDDENCQQGMATGYYSWNQSSTNLQVTLEFDSTAVESFDSCSAGGSSTVTLIDDTLQMTIDSDEISLNKVAETEEAPLGGVWAIDGDLFVFGSNTFAHAKTQNDDPNCQLGAATGTFEWNQDTDMFVTSIHTDSTAIEESDSCSLAGEFTMVREEDSLLFTEGEDEFSLIKIGQ